MSGRILELFERSGDMNLGQTLVRLARLAESVHQLETQRSLADGSDSADCMEAITRAGVGAICTEAGR